MQRVKKLNFLCKDSGGHVYRLIFLYNKLFCVFYESASLSKSKLYFIWCTCPCDNWYNLFLWISFPPWNILSCYVYQWLDVEISILHFLFIYSWYWGGKAKELCNLNLKQYLKFDLMGSNFRNQGKTIALPRPCLLWNQCRTRNVSLLAPMPSFCCETLTSSGIWDVKHQRNWTKKKNMSRQLGTPRKTCSCLSWLPSKRPDQSKQGALLLFYSAII